jgi:hypothetical protein
MVARRKEGGNAGLIPALIRPHFSSWGQVGVVYMSDETFRQEHLD